MPSPHIRLPLSRRGFLMAGAGAGAALGLAPAPALAAARPRPVRPVRFTGRAPDPETLYVDPGGRGDFTTVQAAVNAATGAGYTLVLAPGTYRETVSALVDPATGSAPMPPEMTWIGASEDPRDVVIVYDNAAGTPKPDGSGTYGTTGSATTTVRADGFTARWITFANDWLRADHPDITGTQAVALKVQGDRSAFHHCRFLGHQDTLYADSIALAVFARQYYSPLLRRGRRRLRLRPGAPPSTSTATSAP